MMRSRCGCSKSINKQSDPRVHEHIAKTAIHPIAVIIRKRQRAIIHDPHEARQPALVGTLRLALGIRGGQEKHLGAFDQCPIFWGENRMNLNFIEAVRNAPGVKLILQPPRAFMIEARVGGCHSSAVELLRKPGARRRQSQALTWRPSMRVRAGVRYSCHVRRSEFGVRRRVLREKAREQ